MTPRKHNSSKSSRLIPLILFIALVVVSGYALVATGHFSNPFAFLSTTQGGEHRPEGNLQPPSGGTQVRPARSNNSAAPVGEGGGDMNAVNISWSQLGDVLFNVWFLCATTAVLIVVQKVLAAFIKLIKPRGQPALA